MNNTFSWNLYLNIKYLYANKMPHTYGTFEIVSESSDDVHAIGLASTIVVILLPQRIYDSLVKNEAI